MQNKKKLVQIAIIVGVVLVFLTISGCSVLSYFKKKDIKGASYYKTQIEKHYDQSLATAKKFDSLVKKLNKFYYSPEDFTAPDGFTAEMASLNSELPRAIEDLNKAKAYSVKFSQTSTGKKYVSYISARNDSISNLKKALEQDAKAVQIVGKAFESFYKVFVYSDDLKKAESSNMTSLKLIRSRESQKDINTYFYQMLLKMKAEEEAAQEIDATATTTDTDSADTTDTTETTTTTATTTSSSTTEDIPAWVYEILNDKHISGYYIDFLKKEEKKLDSLFTDLYSIDKDVRFRATKSMLAAVEAARNDISDLRESSEELRDCVTETANKTRELQNLNNRKKSIEAFINELNAQLASRPSSVAPGSLESGGYSNRLTAARKGLSACNEDIKTLNAQLSGLKAARASRLEDNFAGDWWRSAGSVYHIVGLNEWVARTLMKDVKKWKEEKIGSYLKNHYYYFKLARYQTNRAELEFKEINRKLALL